MRVLGWMSGITLRYGIRNDYIRKKLEVVLIEDKIKENILSLVQEDRQKRNFMRLEGLEGLNEYRGLQFKTIWEW